MMGVHGLISPPRQEIEKENEHANTTGGPNKKKQSRLIVKSEKPSRDSSIATKKKVE
jgi:hypothetical protein